MEISKQLVQIIKMKRVFILIFAAFIGAQIVHSCLEEERVGLLHLKSYFKSHDHSRSGDEAFENNWFRSGDRGYNCCAWERIQCNPSTGRVVSLYLDELVNRDDESDNNTKLWLFNVTHFRPFNQLIYLDLRKNGINGLIEHDGSLKISTLSNLTTLALDGNPLRTNYVSFGALTLLRNLSLDDCELNHSVEALGICELRSLQELDLSRNYFHSGVPSCLSNLTSLKVLDLSSSNFNGKFPFWLGNLTLLERLYLFDNSFEGQLFLSSLSNFSMLQELDLESSGLEIQTEDTLWAPAFQLHFLSLGDCNLNKPNGVFPTFLLHQYNLTEVDLFNNNLSGSLPTWIFTNNSKLEALSLSNNSFTGSLLFPNIIQPSLTYLDLSRNCFEGKIPDNIGSIFPNLVHLNMSSNNFEGHIPPSIAHMRDLSVLDVSSNKFSGRLPRALFTHAYSLTYLIVSDNRLQGDIFLTSQLQVLEARNNNFSGTLNISLTRNSALIYLDISNNNIMGQLFGWVYDLTSLNVLLASNNSLHGQIPRKICKLNFLFLDLSHNNFTGSLPQCSNFSTLISLRLNNNKFAGSLPNALSSCLSLREIDLSDNLFSGIIPSWIYKLSNLTVLQLAGNNLQCQISHQLCQLVNIDILDLSRNHLYGRLPRCFQNMSFGVRGESPSALDPDLRDKVEVVAKKHYYSYIGGDQLVMSALDLSCNNLSGVIPTELGELRHIKSLNLSYNYLSGSIPSSFSNLKGVEGLDLSYNKLIGTIPSQLCELCSLEIFNVSFNNLSGITPETNQFATFDESSYLGNPELCVSVVNKHCHQIDILAPTTNKQDEKGKETTFLIEDFWWCFGVTSSIAFLATLAVLAINPYWRRVWFDFAEYHLFWWWF